MKIRRAKQSDLDGINRLLYQVAGVHHNGRPDLFKGNAKKYNDVQLLAIIADDERPVFVGVDEKDQVKGYAFCMFEQHKNDEVLTPIRTLYIDDLCVDENIRGQHVGSRIYNYVLDFARDSGCYHVTLNVWECNPSARKFYDAMGLVPYKTCMEKLL